jgi:hypothetical protein
MYFDCFPFATNQDDLERFFEYILLPPFNLRELLCWHWLGRVPKSGYSIFRWGGKTREGHVFSLLNARGPLPDGYETDHLCRRKDCVNPFHLEAVPQRVNILRSFCLPAINARKTHCIYGHELSGKNLKIALRLGKETRICIQCTRDKQRKAYWDNPDKFREVKRIRYGQLQNQSRAS